MYLFQATNFQNKIKLMSQVPGCPLSLTLSDQYFIEKLSAFTLALRQLIDFM